MPSLKGQTVVGRQAGTETQRLTGRVHITGYKWKNKARLWGGGYLLGSPQHRGEELAASKKPRSVHR